MNNLTITQAGSSPNRAVPQYVQTALVAIANPNTAADLLNLATTLVDPEDGRVIALIVSLGDVEGDAKHQEELQDVIDEIDPDDDQISLETVNSTSIARGILDTAREQGADLIMLGIRNAVRGQVSLGPVVENVMATAPCDVLLFRLAGNKNTFNRVVVPIQDTLESRVAAQIGIRVAKGYKTDAEAMYTQSDGQSQYQSLAHIEAIIADLPGRESIKRTVITAQNPVEAVLTRTHAEDLIIVGFADRSELETWMFGDIARDLLNRAEGPVAVVSHSLQLNNPAKRLWQRFLGWLHPTLTRMEQEDIVRLAQKNAVFNIDYTILILISATIATLGLMLNSVAVIIGAMLVAPLMSPLIGLSVGLTVGRVRIARRAVVTILAGVGMALGGAFLVGILVPLNTPTSEMLARGNPTLIDAGVALASGVVGAYATARKDIPSALAGVAIAAALMPPLCTVGLGIAFNQPTLALGAALLFTTNIICIVIAGVLVFLWLGMSIRHYPDVKTWAQVLAVGLLLLVALPVGLELIQLTRDATEETAIRTSLETALDPADITEFVITRGDPMVISATIRSEDGRLTSGDVRRIEEELGTELGERVQLELVIQPVIRLTVEPVEEEEITVIEETAAPIAEVTAEATPEG